MDTLQSMFPNVEYETLEIVLESQEGDLEAAIEAMLEMVKLDVAALERAYDEA